jgi:DNA-binding protein H-NS
MIRIATLTKGNMGLADRLKGLTKKAEDAAVEHQDEIQRAVQKAEVAADQRTGGKYHEQIQKAGVKADTFVEGLEKTEKAQTTEGTADGEGAPRAS